MSTAGKVKRVPHVHAEVIKAWVDGVPVQYYAGGNWVTLQGPNMRRLPVFDPNANYRIKPEPVRSQGYRRFLYLGRDGVYYVSLCHEGATVTPARIESDSEPRWLPSFAGWIDTEWQYHEVEV